MWQWWGLQPDANLDYQHTLWVSNVLKSTIWQATHPRLHDQANCKEETPNFSQVNHIRSRKHNYHSKKDLINYTIKRNCKHSHMSKTWSQEFLSNMTKAKKRTGYENCCSYQEKICTKISTFCMVYLRQKEIPTLVIRFLNTISQLAPVYQLWLWF